jgi:hypothetical protein
MESRHDEADYVQHQPDQCHSIGIVISDLLHDREIYDIIRNSSRVQEYILVWPRKLSMTLFLAWSCPRMRDVKNLMQDLAGVVTRPTKNPGNK